MILFSPPLVGNIIGHSPQGNFLRQVEEEWGTLMFFADYRSKDRGMQVTPACTNPWLSRNLTRASCDNASRPCCWRRVSSPLCSCLTSLQSLWPLVAQDHLAPHPPLAPSPLARHLTPPTSTATLRPPPIPPSELAGDRPSAATSFPQPGAEPLLLRGLS